ncbi:cytochrome b-c1 complex subunit 6-1, mitochondrial-like [Macadamia integrifolia]|uniref:cytochrome b-c1 complex subunit 6-1, mitochondrial-like n=1 Tax=Macadamia integrifolia TaxID=60698 RepID=UPI001C4F69F7|nr:cytochrome b-c1 complex subunit 6-1, mitochondrial-like [Macadamia integrifolia]
MTVENSITSAFGAFFVLSSLQACVKRIQGDETGHKHCTGQYFDYWSCVDKCVAPKLFSKLK